MGYTKIYPVKKSFSSNGSSSGTLGLISYTTKNKVKEINFDKINLQNPNEVRDVLKVIDYASGDKTVEDDVICKTITSYINCSANPFFANTEMQQIRKHYNKNDDEILGYHLMQSVEECPQEVDIQKFHEIGVQLALEVFKGFQVVVSTHTNTDNIHNHIVINAVNMASGKKWYDNDATKDLIRKVSDRLLEENGFKILEDTRDFKRYYRKDRNEKNHLKNTDYRNSEAYVEWKAKKVSSKEIIKSDIMTILPFVKSYDELIERLLENGYTIRYKTKTGKYYKHITFKLPFRDKGVRDYQLSEDGFFTRENLTALIEKQNKEKENDFVNWASQFEKDVETSAIKYSLKDNKYYRFKFNGKYLDELNEKYRVIMGESEKEPLYRFRSSDDITAIKDIKYYHELLQDESKQYWKNKKFKREDDSEYETYVWQDKKLKYYFDRINANMTALSFSETEDIGSVKEAVANIEMLYSQRKNIDAKFYSIKKLIIECGEDAIIINQYRDILNKIEVCAGNEGYSEKDLENQKRLAESYLERLTMRGLESAEAQDKLLKNYQNYKQRFVELVNGAKVVTDKLKEYDEYMRTMRYINQNQITGNGCFNEELDRYDFIRQMNKGNTKSEKIQGDEKETKEKQREREKERSR